MEKQYRDILKNATLLLVDDDSEIRGIFKKTISSYVCNVYEASNGNEALNIYSSKLPDIIITDIKMPLMDGLLLVNALRDIDRKVPIVAISAYSEVDTLVKLASLKLVDYLIKPINFEQLISTLTKCAIELEESGRVEAKLAENIIYSFSKKSIISNNKTISLTPNEITLIELLIANENKLVTKSQIEDIVYDNQSVSDNAINILVSKVRKKIGKNIISAISSYGYLLVVES